jgi:hypothetical protein
MKVIEEEADLLLIEQFYSGFQHFWLQAELLSHQNMMMINTFGKAKKIKASKLGRMNQLIILSVKQWLLSI